MTCCSNENITVLVTDIKRHLNITWNSDDTDSKIEDYTRMGIAYLNDKRGAPADYSEPGTPRTLLFEYVRYIRDNALDVFENNYRSQILAMQNNRAVNGYVEESI